MEIQDDQVLRALNQALFGYSMQKFAGIQPTERFVHYTSGETAMRILKGEPNGKRYLWLRNASDMNDFSEIQWGRYCFHEAVILDNELGTRFEKLVNQIEPNMAVNLANAMTNDFEHMQANTHLVSLALHNEAQSKTGLLSMWRAYGGPDNVCLVFNTAAFTGHQQAYELV